jgi:hypothetical protein
VGCRGWDEEEEERRGGLDYLAYDFSALTPLGVPADIKMYKGP